MRRPATRRVLAAAVTTAVVGALVAVPAAAAPGNGKGNGKSSAPVSEHRSTGTNYNQGKKLPFSRAMSESSKGKFSDSYKVGTVRRWPALDDAKGVIYNKNYRLRGIGNNIEVWVAENTAFPNPNDCRNQLGLTQITDSQVAGFIHEFDNTMYPLESEAFSVAPSRDGASTPLTRAYAQYFGLAARNFKGQGDRIVTLVDNVRDTNFYDPRDENGRTFIGGFFYSVFNEYTNRNVMTIDAYDWLHRTGANPPDNADEAAYQACSDYLLRAGLGTSRPRDYEGTFAHEYQHLLEYYADPDEVSWLNEGLSDYAQTLTGYVDVSLDPEAPDADGHLASFLGFLEGFGGPEQSLTQWEDQGPPEILADYGAAYSFLHYLGDHFGGVDFISSLHTGQENGFAGLQEALDGAGYSIDAIQVLKDWLVSVAVDSELDRGATVIGGDAAALQMASQSSRVNWATEEAYSSPGAPTNGADYVRLRSNSGPLTAGALNSVAFNGALSYPASPVEWTETSDGRLYSGSGDNFDRALVREVTIPASDATLSLDLEWDTEIGWDYLFVQVYDEAAQQWVSLSSQDTTSNSDPGAIPLVVANLPGLTGASAGVQTEVYDASAFAGKTVKVAVRYITDPGVANPGVWLSGMAVGGTAVADATDLSAWMSLTEAVPVAVEGWHVSLVAYTPDNGPVRVGELPLTKTAGGWTGSLSGAALTGIVGSDATVVAALVTAIDSSELIGDYPTYSLTANGGLQPGGS